MNLPWPFKKKTVRPPRRMYAAAKINRLTSDFVTSSTSQDSELRSSLVAIRNRSRQLARDNDYVRNLLYRTLPNNVIGCGIPFQSQVMMERGQKLNEPLNDQIESAWKRWQHKSSCHVAGTLSFQDIERLGVSTVGESGEFIVRMVSQRMGKSKVPLALELIEADLLDESYNAVLSNGREVRMGVEVNQWKRPVAYWFFTKHPGDHQSIPSLERRDRRVRVDASEIIHLFQTERIGQTRGVPRLVSAIMRLHHMHGYEEAEVVAARASASLMGFIETPEAEPSIKDDTQDGQSVTEFEPGVFKKLAAGEKAHIESPARPGGQFEPFMRQQLRGVAAGGGVSYESASKDYSQSNYSSSRLSILDERDNYRAIQEWMTRNFHQVVFEAWLDRAVLCGELNLKNYETHPELYQGVKWMPRGWAWVDPAKEVSAYKDAILGGLTTQTEVVAQAGGDIVELFTQRKRETDLAKSMGLKFDTDPQTVAEQKPAPFGGDAAGGKKPPKKKPAEEDEPATD